MRVESHRGLIQGGKGSQLLGRRRLTIFGGSARAIAGRNTLSDLVVPLLLTPAPEEADDDHGHVVAPNASGLRIRCQAVIHHVLADLLEVLLGGNATPHKLNDSLRRLAIPDT